jgi:pSer/pThr/pTyr-binding forkhead associated (FHA) protein
VSLDGAPIRIGRAPDNDLVLADDRISRHHARIQGRGGVLVLTDLDSTNGSFVNGRRAQEVVLGDGDRLQFGRTVLSVERAAGGPWTGA